MINIIPFKQGWLNLCFSKMRASLALLGILVGTASVVAMILGGELATNEALKQFKTMGTDLLAVAVNPSMTQESKSSGHLLNLNLQQAFQVKKSNPNILELAPYTQLFHPIFYKTHLLNSIILGVTDSFADIFRLKIPKGRFVSRVDEYRFYCVIGHELYQAMKKISYKEPLGQSIQIGNNLFTIIGAAAPWGENNFMDADINNAVLIPIMASTLINKMMVINNIVMRLKSNADIQTIETNVTSFIQTLLPNKVISFRSAKELIEKMENQNNILTVFLALMGSISLIVGGIGVMNIMLVSVMERRREIGVRRAVGALQSDIWILFLIEAVMLTLIGGSLGVLVGITIVYFIAWIWQWEFTLFLLPPLIGFMISVLTGILSGFYPAYLASRLDPIEALRLE